MMRPLRYKSRKGSTCNIRSSNFPLSPFLSTIRPSVRLSTLLAVAPSTSSVIDRIYTTFQASIILRPAASLSNILRAPIPSQKLVRPVAVSTTTVLLNYINRLRVLISTSSFDISNPSTHLPSQASGRSLARCSLCIWKTDSCFQLFSPSSIILRPSTSTHKNRSGLPHHRKLRHFNHAYLIKLRPNQHVPPPHPQVLVRTLEDRRRALRRAQGWRLFRDDRKDGHTQGEMRSLR